MMTLRVGWTRANLVQRVLAREQSEAVVGMFDTLFTSANRLDGKRCAAISAGGRGANDAWTIDSISALPIDSVLNNTRSILRRCVLSDASVVYAAPRWSGAGQPSRHRSANLGGQISPSCPVSFDELHANSQRM